MTELLQRAIAEVSKLSDEDQDAIATRLLAELEDEQAQRGTMHNLFPGMNPYLEQPGLWPQVHNR